MKKLILLLGLLVCSNAHAGLVDLPSYVSGNDVTITNLQTTNTTIENWANGNVEGGVNIKPGSLVSSDFSASVSPITRQSEMFGNFTYTGMLPVTDASLTSNISAGTSYVTGYRVVIGTTAHTYTASKDTYVYVNQGGYYNYDAVANGATAPTNYTSANGNLLLAKVVTSGTAITSVSDLRTLSLPITVTTSNFPANYRSGAYTSRDTTTTLHAEAGSLSIGSAIYTRTTNTSAKNITTGTNWIEGSQPSMNGQIFLYAYNDSGTSWDFKFSSADVVYSDVSGSTAGILRYYTTGGVNYRAIGWAYMSADTVLAQHTSDIHDMDTSNNVEFTATTSTTVSTTSTSFVNDYGMPRQQFYSSGRPIMINYDVATVNSAADNTRIGIMIDSVDIASTERWHVDGTTTSTNLYGINTSWMGILPRGIHTIQGRFKAGSGTSYINMRRLTVVEL